MVNREIQTTWYYHNGTKHPHGNLMDPRHSFDPSSQPLLFKIYPELDPIPLPFEASPSVVPALSAISMEVIPSVSDGTLDITTLSSILYFSAGITKRLNFPWGSIPFRAANRRRQRPDQGHPKAPLTPNRRPTAPQCRRRPAHYFPNSHSSSAC